MGVGEEGGGGGRGGEFGEYVVYAEKGKGRREGDVGSGVGREPSSQRVAQPSDITARPKPPKRAARTKGPRQKSGTVRHGTQHRAATATCPDAPRACDHVRTRGAVAGAAGVGLAGRLRAAV